MIKTTAVLFLIITSSYAIDDETSLSDSEEDLSISLLQNPISAQEKEQLENFDKQFSSVPLRDNDLIIIWETIRELEAIYCKTWLSGAARTLVGKRNIIALSNIKSSLEGKNQYILQQKTQSIIENLTVVGTKARIQENFGMKEKTQ